MLRALRHKNTMDAQSGAQGLFEQVRPFDSRKRKAVLAGQFAPVLAGMGQRTTQILQAHILLTLYNAIRHRRVTC